MKTLLIAMVAWLSANFDLPANYELPEVRFAAPADIASIHFGAFSVPRQREAAAARDARLPDQPPSVVAVYVDRQRTIVLPAGWQGVSPAEQSVLVHELVHHLQNIASLTYACPQEREALAYAAQEKWLQRFGKSLESEFEIDGMTLLVKTNCPR
jgi:hypothetical protein